MEYCTLPRKTTLFRRQFRRFELNHAFIVNVPLLSHALTCKCTLFFALLLSKFRLLHSLVKSDSQNVTAAVSIGG